MPVYIQTNVFKSRTTRAHRDGINDLDNALGGFYNHPQHGSRPRVSDQQLFNYMIIMLTALL